VKHIWFITGFFSLFALVLGACLYIRATPELPFLATLRPLPSRVPSAFYAGGLERGTGGQVSQENYQSLFHPSPASSFTGALLPVEAYPSPDTCARCHVGIHENWKGSMHAVSATDEWYLKVKELLAFEEGEGAVRMCAGCHAPVALMTGEVGLYNRESASSQQGVSCIFCHTLESVTGHSGAWVSNPGRVRMYRGGDYLSETEIEAAAHLVMASPGVHKADMHRPLYEDSSLCMSCHQFEMNGVKLQSTFEEWQESSYADQGVTCQGCHFTPGAGVTYPDPGHLVEHYPTSHEHIFRHTLGGASTVIAPNTEKNVAILKEAVELQVKIENNGLEVTVFNRKAGHSVPSGVGDLRLLWLEVVALDESGTEIFTSGKADAAGYLPEDTVQFHQVLGDVNGNPIVRHDIWRATQVLEDTRIPADGSVSSSFALPSATAIVMVRLLWRDAPAEFEQRVLNRSGTTIPVIELASWQKTF
jgi:Cytochrome c554 and c-prime